MNFAEKVLKVVSKIPRGSVMTYKEVAKAAGRPRAYRAVGNILNKNPHPACRHLHPKGEGKGFCAAPCPLEVPCHRVVKSDGTVGGYVGGRAKKITLLKQEGLIIKNKKVV